MLKEFINKIYKYSIDGEEKITTRGRDKIFTLIYNTHYKEIVDWYLNTKKFRDTIPTPPKFLLGDYVDKEIMGKYFKKDIPIVGKNYAIEVSMEDYIIYTKIYTTHTGDIPFPKDLSIVKLLKTIELPKNSIACYTDINRVESSWDKQEITYKANVALKLLFLDRYLYVKEKVEGNQNLLDVFTYFYSNVEIQRLQIEAYSDFNAYFVQQVGWQKMTLKGRLGKRTRSFIYKTLHKKATTTLIESIENYVDKHSSAKDGYYMIGKFKGSGTPWGLNDFGQSDGSCYWSGREEAFRIFYDNNNVFYFMVHYNLNLAGADTKDKIDKIIDAEGYITAEVFGSIVAGKYPFAWLGTSRAWVIDGFSPIIRADSIAIWNHYGPGTRIKYAEVLADIFNKVLKEDKWYVIDDDKIVYTHATYDDGILWLNGKPAFVGTSESARHFNVDRLNIDDSEQEEYEYTCEHCDNGMNDAYYLEEFDGPLCENCYFDNRRVCAECGEECWGPNMTYDKVTKREYCTDCHEELINNREEERKEIEENIDKT